MQGRDVGEQEHGSLVLPQIMYTLGILDQVLQLRIIGGFLMEGGNGERQIPSKV